MKANLSPNGEAYRTMKVYKVGTKVFCDFLHNKPNGKVIRVIKPGDGKGQVEGEIEVRLTETKGGYKKGEKLIIKAYQAVPVAQEKRGGYFRRINTLYRYE